MEDSSYITAIVAGSFYLIASYRLLRLSGRTGERPECWLGIYFAASGQWYVLYNAPYLLGLESLPPLFEHAVEWIYAVGVFPYLLFIRSVFRPRSSWATALVVVSALFLLTGAAASTLGGSFSNVIDDPAYWIEWIGYTIPSCWMCSEGFRSYSAARKRVRMGLCDPIVANRYLLFGCFGFCQIASCAADLVWAYENSTGGVSTEFAYGMLSVTEIASVGALWLAFFPPGFYRRWIDGRAALLTASARVP